MVEQAAVGWRGGAAAALGVRVDAKGSGAAAGPSHGNFENEIGGGVWVEGEMPPVYSHGGSMADRASVTDKDAEAGAFGWPRDQEGGHIRREHRGGGGVARGGPVEDDGVRGGGGEMAAARRGAHAEVGPVPAGAW